MTEHKKAEWNGNEHNLPDGSYIDNNGDVCYFKNGKWHREGGPAREYANGRKEWCINGKFHRDDGPAREWANGDKAWYRNDKLHRDDGPAIEKVNGDKKWLVNGKWHREDGPAVICANGSKEWWINDVQYSEEEFNKKVKELKQQTKTESEKQMTKHTKAEWRDTVHNLPDGSYIDKEGDVCYVKDGKRHREDGPAVTLASGYKFWYKDGEYHRDDGPAVERANGDKEWWVNGLLHRDGGPAIECFNGNKLWYKNNKLYREDGPAVELANGTKKWYIDGVQYSEEEFNKKVKELKQQTKTESEKQMTKYKKFDWHNDTHDLPDGSYIDSMGDVLYIKNGKFHREDGPAIEWADGNRTWYKNGELHREDGPAIEYTSGDKFWYKNDKKHREDGPAVELANGTKKWYIDGVQYSEEEYNKKVKELKTQTKLETESEKQMTKHTKAEWHSNGRSLPDGSYIDSIGDVCYIKNGKRHREDGPAIEWADGHKEWCVNGKLHRDGGPAIEYANGDKEWYKNGKRHREDGPAIEWANGGKMWFITGKKHREDGPAVEWDSYKEWYINDIQYSEEEYNKKMSEIKSQTETGSEKQMDSKVKSLTYGEIIDSAAIRSGVDLYSNGIRSAVKYSLNGKVDDKLIDNDVFNSIVLLASSSVIDSFNFSNSVIESIKEECTIAGIAKSIEFTIDNISTIASNMSGPIEKLLGKDDIKELRIFGEEVGVATTEFEETKSEDLLKQSK